MGVRRKQTASFYNRVYLSYPGRRLLLLRPSTIDTAEDLIRIFIQHSSNFIAYFFVRVLTVELWLTMFVKRNLWCNS